MSLPPLPLQGAVSVILKSLTMQGACNAIVTLLDDGARSVVASCFSRGFAGALTRPQGTKWPDGVRSFARVYGSASRAGCIWVSFAQATGSGAHARWLARWVPTIGWWWLRCADSNAMAFSRSGHASAFTSAAEQPCRGVAGFRAST